MQTAAGFETFISDRPNTADKAADDMPVRWQCSGLSGLREDESSVQIWVLEAQQGVRPSTCSQEGLVFLTFKYSQKQDVTHHVTSASTSSILTADGDGVPTPLADTNASAGPLTPQANPEAPGDERHEDVSLDSQVSARLFASYLAHIHPIWPILYMPMYEQGGYGLQHTSFPQPVIYAIYAIAACTEATRNDDLAERRPPAPSPAVLFESALLSMQRYGSDRASSSSQFHPLNMLRPSIASCQALVILALQQHGLGETSHAAILCSIAAGMAIDLRLNEALPPNSEHTTVQIHSRLWWNLFILDKMLETERGRPFRLRSEDITAPWPSVSEADEFQLIKVPEAGSGRLMTIKTYSMSGFEKTIQLCILMESVAREVSSPTKLKRLQSDLAAAEPARAALLQKLKEYQGSLETSKFGLQGADGYRPVVTPVAIINSVWSSACVILLNQPFVRTSEKHQSATPEDLDTDAHPKDLCITAARAICDVLSTYREYLTSIPCDLIFPIVLSAAVVWQFRTEMEQELGTDVVAEQLELCVNCLSIVNSCWKNAGRYREKLLTHINSPISCRAAGARRGQAHGAEQSATAASPLETPTASTVPAFAVLNFLGDRFDGFGSTDDGFKDYLETRLSRLSSPNPDQ